LLNVPAETHGDGAGGDFGYAGGENNGGGGIGSGESGSEGEGDGKAIGNADDDVADDFAGGEVLLGVVSEKAFFLRFQGGSHCYVCWLLLCYAHKYSLCSLVRSTFSLLPNKQIVNFVLK